MAKFAVGPRQRVSNVNVGTSPTAIITLSDVMGAAVILCRAYDGPNSNVFTFVFTPSFDGVNGVDGGYTYRFAPNSPAGVTDGLGGLGVAVFADRGSTIGPSTFNPFPFILVTGSFATTGGFTSFDFWPLFETDSYATPNLSLS